MRRLLAVLAVLALVAVAYAWAPWRAEPAIRVPSGPYVASGPASRALLWAVGDGADG